MDFVIERACLQAFEKICPAGYAIAVNIDAEEFDWVNFHYPPAWVERYIEGEYVLEDPTLEFAKSRTGHVTWRDLREEFPGSRVLSEAEDFGLCDGSTIVINIGGVKSIASGAGRAWTAAEVRTLTVALKALHSLHAKVRGPALEKKQLEVVQLMAQGLRDSEIADALGIKPVSVRSRRAAALSLTGSKTPAQLVAYAARANLI